MECKSALQESNGDLEAAVTILRKRGLASLTKKSGRETKDGLIGSYIHNGKIGVMVEVNCETDFVARNPDFQTLVKDIAMHIAASDPRFIRKEDVTEDVLAKEREIYTAQARATGKPENVLDKIVDGRMSKYYSESVPPGAALCEGSCNHGPRSHRRAYPENRREHPGSAVYSLQAWRVNPDPRSL